GALHFSRGAGREERLSVGELQVRNGAPGRIVNLGHHFLSTVAGTELRFIRQLLERVVVPEFHLDATIQGPSLPRFVGGERVGGTATVAFNCRGRQFQR